MKEAKVIKGIIFDLETFRKERLNGMSQEDFAKQIGISQDKVSRMEKDPKQISLEIIMEIAMQFGMTLDELVSFQKPSCEPLIVDYTWSSPEYFKQSLSEYTSHAKENSILNPCVKEMEQEIKKAIRKPKIAFIGRSDTGKSTMINAMLGVSRLPTRWSPATAIAIYIKHTNDRPDYMTEDVWIFKSDAQSNEAWDDMRLDEEDYCSSLKLSSGNYDLLNTYGTRTGEHFAQSDATAAVVFIESNLLLNCDFVDLPGYGTGDRFEDDEISLREKSKADVLVYLSIANGFMRSEDILYIKDAAASLTDIASYSDSEIKPLSNLFIVASQAHVVNCGNPGELEEILSAGCERLEKSLTDGFWKSSNKPDSLLDRFYTYTLNNPGLCNRFENDFCLLIELLPHIIELKARDVIKKWVENKRAILQGTLTDNKQLLSDKSSFEEYLNQCIGKEPNRRAAFAKARQKTVERILKYRNESLEKINSSFNNTICVEEIAELMKERGVKKKKEDIQVFVSYLSGLVQDEANEILNENAKRFAKDVDSFLVEFESNSFDAIENSVLLTVSPFNKNQAFAAGLAGVATYGALAVWASSFGNLGGYIIVAKGVSLLSALGISVGGTAAAASAVASIGGPVVLGIAIALTAAVTAFAAFSGTWMKNTAKKIVNSFRNERVLDKLCKSINAYWDETLTAFNSSADSLNSEWIKHLESIRQKIDSYDADKISAEIAETETICDFIQNIPC